MGNVSAVMRTGVVQKALNTMLEIDDRLCDYSLTAASGVAVAGAGVGAGVGAGAGAGLDVDVGAGKDAEAAAVTAAADARGEEAGAQCFLSPPIFCDLCVGTS